jgi:hypothetical protein
MATCRDFANQGQVLLRLKATSGSLIRLGCGYGGPGWVGSGHRGGPSTWKALTLGRSAPLYSFNMPLYSFNM